MEKEIALPPSSLNEALNSLMEALPSGPTPAIIEVQVLVPLPPGFEWVVEGETVRYEFPHDGSATKEYSNTYPIDSFIPQWQKIGWPQKMPTRFDWSFIGATRTDNTLEGVASLND